MFDENYVFPIYFEIKLIVQKSLLFVIVLIL